MVTVRRGRLPFRPLALAMLVAPMVIGEGIGSLAAQAAPRPRPLTAEEYASAFNLFAGDNLTPVSSTNGYSRLVKPDAVKEEILRRAQAWVAELQSGSVSGIQLDPMGQLFVAVGHDSIAKAQFAARLGTVGLSLGDRAYTNLLAMSVFGGGGTPERLQTARGYLANILAMPAPASHRWQYEGHRLMANIAYMNGLTEEVAQNALKAYAIAVKLPFERRDPVFKDGLFVVMADALSGMPNGRAVIDSVGKVLLPLAIPTKEQIAQNEEYDWTGKYWTEIFTRTLALTAYLGKPAPDVLGMHWYNMTAPSKASDSTPSAKVLSHGDGVIRVMEFGSHGCGYCMMALPQMEKVHQAKIPNAQVIFVTETEGSWGTTVTAPDEESELLRHFYLDQKKYTFPIAMWAGVKAQTEDGGMLPKNNPSSTSYPISGTPTFVTVDGKGIVRHISVGYSKQLAQSLTANLNFLAKEKGGK